MKEDGTTDMEQETNTVGRIIRRCMMGGYRATIKLSTLLVHKPPSVHGSKATHLKAIGR